MDEGWPMFVMFPGTKMHGLQEWGYGKQSEAGDISFERKNDVDPTYFISSCTVGNWYIYFPQ